MGNNDSLQLGSDSGVESKLIHFDLDTHQEEAEESLQADIDALDKEMRELIHGQEIAIALQGEEVTDESRRIMDKYDHLLRQLVRKRDHLEYLKASKRFSEDEMDRLWEKFQERKPFTANSTLISYVEKAPFPYWKLASYAAEYPDYFTFEDILYCLFEHGRLTPNYANDKNYPNIDKYDGFPVKDRIELGRCGNDGGPVDPEKAKKDYLPLLRDNLGVYIIMWLEQDGISLEKIARFDEKFSGHDIRRLTMSGVSPERSLELTDGQLKKLGIEPKGQNSSIQRKVANALFLAIKKNR